MSSNTNATTGPNTGTGHADDSASSTVRVGDTFHSDLVSAADDIQDDSIFKELITIMLKVETDVEHSALFSAIREGSKKVFTGLVQGGVDLRACATYRRGMISYCGWDSLLSNCPRSSVSPFAYALALGHYDMASCLITDSVVAERSKHYMEMAMHKECPTELIRLMLGRGLPIDYDEYMPRHLSRTANRYANRTIIANECEILSHQLGQESADQTSGRMHQRLRLNIAHRRWDAVRLLVSESLRRSIKVKWENRVLRKNYQKYDDDDSSGVFQSLPSLLRIWIDNGDDTRTYPFVSLLDDILKCSVDAFVVSQDMRLRSKKSAITRGDSHRQLIGHIVDSNVTEVNVDHRSRIFEILRKHGWTGECPNTDKARNEKARATIAAAPI